MSLYYTRAQCQATRHIVAQIEQMRKRSTNISFIHGKSNENFENNNSQAGFQNLKLFISDSKSTNGKSDTNYFYNYIIKIGPYIYYETCLQCESIKSKKLMD